MQALVHPRLGLPMLTDTYRRPVRPRPGRPLPPPLASSNAVKSAHEKLAQLGRQPGMTIRKLYRIMAGASGHNVVVGTAAEVADLMEDWFTRPRCDGFNLMPAFMPAPAFEALEWLVPELQRRGLFQTAYGGDGTLRGSLGLLRPPHGSHRRRDQPAGASP